MPTSKDHAMNSDNAPDPRVHPYRDDIAADFLEGKVEALNPVV